MATSDLKVAVSTEVELAVGPATSAWLVSLGWTAPVEEAAEVELMEKVRAPETGAEAAAAAVKGREAGRLMAQNLRAELMGELSSPERVDTLLSLCGVKLDALVAPVVGAPAPEVEVPPAVEEPVVESEAPSAVSES